MIKAFSSPEAAPPLSALRTFPQRGRLGGEGVDQRETDEGTTFPVDFGLGVADRLPRNKKKPSTLC